MFKIQQNSFPLRKCYADIVHLHGFPISHKTGLLGQVTRFNRNASFAADLLKEFSRKENYTIHELSQESFRFCLNMHCIEYGVNINVFNKSKH